MSNDRYTAARPQTTRITINDWTPSGYVRVATSICGTWTYTHRPTPTGGEWVVTHNVSGMFAIHPTLIAARTWTATPTATATLTAAVHSAATGSDPDPTAALTRVAAALSEHHLAARRPAPPRR